MNNIVTAMVSGQEKTSQVNTSATGNASLGGFSDLASSVGQGDIESFQHALQRFHDDFTYKEVKDDTDLNGNNMPLSALIPELPAQNDHELPSVKMSLDDALTLEATIETGVTLAVQSQAAKSDTVNMPVLHSVVAKLGAVNMPGFHPQAVKSGAVNMTGLHTQAAKSGAVNMTGLHPPAAKSGAVNMSGLQPQAAKPVAVNMPGLQPQAAKPVAVNIPGLQPQAEKSGAMNMPILQPQIEKTELVSTPLENAGAEHQASALENNVNIKRMSSLNQLPTTPVAESGFIKNGEAKSAITQTRTLTKVDLNADESSDALPLTISENSNSKLSAGMADINQSLRQINVPGQGVTIAPQMSPLTSNVDMNNSEKVNQLLASLPVDAEVDIHSELSMLPSKMHTMLKMGASSAGKIVQAGNHRQITSNIRPVTPTLESALVKSSDTLLSKIEPLDLMGQIVANTTNQQQMQPNTLA
ncbi:MAG: hypothetical protein DRQ44_11450, partial [Gammaproteobacteria bacterium]